MIDDKDIQKLKKELATKQDLERFATKEGLEKFSDRSFEVFATKEDLAALTNHVISIEEKVETLATKEDFNNLLTAVDAYAKKADTFFQEMVMLSHQVKRNEQWIHQIADKLDLKLEY